MNVRTIAEQKCKAGVSELGGYTGPLGVCERGARAEQDKHFWGADRQVTWRQLLLPAARLASWGKNGPGLKLLLSKRENQEEGPGYSCSGGTTAPAKSPPDHTGN